jgi:uncharacterized protein (DUF305 family)
MAHAELAKGSNPQLKKVATGIVTAQAKEIGQMNSWRSDWPAPQRARRSGGAGA